MSGRTADLLSTLFNVRRGEGRALVVAAAYFFVVLCALMLLRPARDALGMQRGMDDVRWLFIGTAVVTLAMNPVFGWLVSQLRRMRFIAATYGFFALSLLGFYALLVWAPDAVGQLSGQVFYVWFSVFNFFATMLFWALMVDRFATEPSYRLFPIVSAGGTIGAIAGSAVASQLSTALGTPSLLLIAAALLAMAVGLAALLVRATRQQHVPGAIDGEGPIGGSAWAGLRSVWTSRYLSGIALYVLILSVMMTFLYFTRLQMVSGLEGGLDERTALFAQVDLYTQIATLLAQLVFAGHLIRRIGMPLTLALLPLVTALGFIGLAVVASLMMLVIVESVFKAVQRAVMRPARESLFTVLEQEEKYKAKAFIDTFVYRAGDVLGAQTEGLLGRLGFGLVGLASVAVPLALLWGLLGLWLGSRQAHAPRNEALYGHGVDPTPRPAAD